MAVQIFRLTLCFFAVAIFGFPSTRLAQAQNQDTEPSAFVDEGNGTFKHEQSGLVFLKDPSKSPRATSIAQAEAWVAKLKSGEHGLNDGSKPGDWRLPTQEDLSGLSFVPESRGGLQGRDYFVTSKTMGVMVVWSGGGMDISSLDNDRPLYIWPVRGGGGSGEDLYDYDAAKLVVKLDQRMEDEHDNYTTHTKTLSLSRFNAEVRVTVQVIKDEAGGEDYYTIAFVTPGANFGGQGLGDFGGLLPYSSDWNLRKETQAIYANGAGLKAAIDDLEKKFNGAQGRCTFTGTGDAAKGELVITMLGPYSVDADGGAVRRSK